MQNQSIQWRPVVGYEGIYEVSDAGAVRRDLVASRAPGRRLRGTFTPKGYVRVRLSDGVHARVIPVHRIVARAFHGEPQPGQQVCHGNGVRSDNRAENLRWGTSQENRADAVAAGTALYFGKRPGLATHCKQGHELTSDNVYEWGGNRKCRRCTIARTAASRVRAAVVS